MRGLPRETGRQTCGTSDRQKETRPGPRLALVEGLSVAVASRVGIRCERQF